MFSNMVACLQRRKTLETEIIKDLESAAATASEFRNISKNYADVHDDIFTKITCLLGQSEDERKQWDSLTEKFNRENQEAEKLRSQLTEVIAERDALILKLKSFTEAQEAHDRTHKLLRENEEKRASLEAENARLLEENRKSHAHFTGLYCLYQDKVKELNELTDKYDLLKSAHFAIFEETRQTHSIYNEPSTVKTSDYEDRLPRQSNLPSPIRDAKSEIRVVDLKVRFTNSSNCKESTNVAENDLMTCSFVQSQNNSNNSIRLSSFESSFSSCLKSGMLNDSTMEVNDKIINAVSSPQSSAVNPSDVFGCLVNVVERKSSAEISSHCEQYTNENVLNNDIVWTSCSEVVESKKQTDQKLIDDHLDKLEKALFNGSISDTSDKDEEKCGTKNSSLKKKSASVSGDDPAPLMEKPITSQVGSVSYIHESERTCNRPDNKHRKPLGDDEKNQEIYDKRSSPSYKRKRLS